METQTSTFKQYSKIILIIFAITVTLTSFMYAFSSSAQDKIAEEVTNLTQQIAQNSAKWEDASKEVDRLNALIDAQAKLQNKAQSDNLILKNKRFELEGKLTEAYKTPARRVVAPSPVPKSQPTE